MRVLGIAAAVVAVAALGPATARADTCSINGTAYTCEAFCIGTTACNVETVGHATCDNPLLGGNGDGWCTICGDGAANTITGTSGADIICGKGGNDTIYGDPTGAGAGDMIDAGSGDDTVLGRAGNDLILGGTGDDTLRGGDGDDEVDGEDGDDLVYGDHGNDVVRGGDGSDYVEGGWSPLISSEIGDIICGGKGDDALAAFGYGHFCFDPGPDQTGNAFGLGWDCSYIGPTTKDDGDLATQRNCAAVDASGDAFHSSTRSCNCQD